MSDKHYGVILKYSDQHTPSPGTIEIHRQLIQSEGYSWFGKFGKIVGKNISNILLDQVKNDIDTYLFLISHYNLSKHKTIHCCPIIDISYNKSDIDVFPSYYPFTIKSWFKINSIIDLHSEMLKHLYGRTSNVPIVSTLYKSMNPLMMVYYAKDLQISSYMLE